MTTTRTSLLLAALAVGVAACGGDPPPQAQKTPRPAPARRATVDPAQQPLPPAGPGGPKGARAVAFRAGDGVGLRGRLFGRGRAAVVLAHMGNRPDSEADWYPLARRLAREGYLVLTYNRRAVCTGERRPYDCSAGGNDFGLSWQDVIGAVRFIEAQGADRYAVGGASIGGTASVYAVARGDIRPAALISLAGVNHISTYSLDRAGVSRIGGAKLFVSGRGDVDGGVETARELHGWAREPKQLVLPDSDRHGTDLLAPAEPTSGPLTRLILRFLRAAMAPG